MVARCKKFDGGKFCGENEIVTMTGFWVLQKNQPEKTRIWLCSQCAKDVPTCRFHDEAKGTHNGRASYTAKLKIAAH